MDISVYDYNQENTTPIIVFLLENLKLIGAYSLVFCHSISY